MGKARLKRFLKFCLFSNSGAFLNASILWIGHKIWHIPVLILTPFAILATIFCNFNINDKFTWKGASKSELTYLARFWRYLSTSLAGAACTYLVIIILYKILDIDYIYAIMSASLSGALTNFTIYDFIQQKYC